MAVENATVERKENMLVNIVFNIAIPALILAKLSTPERLGPVTALIAAICFPLSYGLYDLIKSGKWNFFSILGLLSTLLTGGFALMKLPIFWFAVKEASIPTLFGLATLISLKTRYPIVKKVLLNPALINIELINQRLAEDRLENDFEKILVKSTYLLTASFIVSAILNFSLAIYLLKSSPGTPAFNEELGKMFAWSYPVIVIPSMLVVMGSLWYLVSNLKKLTNMDLAEILHAQKE